MSHRVVGVIAIGLVAVTLVASGCASRTTRQDDGTLTSPPASGGSDGLSPTPSDTPSSPPRDVTKLRPAVTAKLPTKLHGWTANGPIESTDSIESGSYTLAGKTNLAVVNITRNPELSARQMLADMMVDDPQPIGAALCGTVGLKPTSTSSSAMPSAGSIICLVDLDGGVLNVSGPATVTMSEYATFANALYGSFPA